MRISLISICIQAALGNCFNAEKVMRICEAIKRMIESPVNSAYDINHMLMVHAFASSIGKLEGLDEHKQYVLELAAVLHDISCPYLREKYGSAA